MRRDKFKRGRLIGITLLLLVFLLSAYPILKIVVKSFSYDSVFSFRNYFNIVKDPNTLVIFKNTLVVCFFVVLFSTIIGVTLAWIVERTTIPFRENLRVLLSLPYLIPPFVAAFAWRQLLGPVGYINKIYMHLFSKSEPLLSIYGAHGIIIVLTLLTYPVIYIITVRALSLMNPELEEAAEVSGAGKLKIVLTVTLPMAFPSITGGVVLVFASCISNFGVPAVLGLPANYPVLTTAIYTTILDYTRSNNLAHASALSIVLIVMGIAVLLFQKSMIWKGSYSTTGQKLVFKHKKVGLGRSQTLFFVFALLIVFLTTIAPIGVLVVDSLIKAYGLPLAVENLTLRNYVKIFTMRLTQNGFKNSVFLALTAASSSLLLGFAVAYSRIRLKKRASTVLDFLGTIPNNVPGTVLALGIILAWIKPIPLLNYSIYGTIWIIFICYVSRYLAIALRTCTGALEQFNYSLEEVAQISGASRLQTIRDITFPVLRPMIMGGWLLMAVPMLNELTVSIILYTSGRETIGVAAFSLIQEGAITTSSALSVLMIAFVFIGNFISKKVTRGKMSLL